MGTRLNWNRNTRARIGKAAAHAATTYPKVKTTAQEMFELSMAQFGKSERDGRISYVEYQRQKREKQGRQRSPITLAHVSILDRKG